jgi:hypothetical protein
VSELLEIRVIGEPEAAIQAVARLGELLDVDRYGGPYPSRKTPGLVRCYLTGRLRATAAPARPLGDTTAHVWDGNGICQRHGGYCSMAPTSPNGGEAA